MRKYHRLEVLRYATYERGPLGLFGTSFKMMRSRMFGQRRIYFGLASTELSKLPVIEIPEYEIKMFTSWDTVNKSLRERLGQHKGHFGLELEEMLKMGAYLWIGYVKGDAASFAWTQTGDQVRSHFFPLMSDDVMITRCVTISSYRGLGLFPATLLHIVSTLGARGIRRFYVGCADWNLFSQRGIERAGFKLLGHGVAKKPNHYIWHQVSRPDFTRPNHEVGS